MVVTPEQYRRLARYIRESFQLDEAGRSMPLIGRGSGWSDVFYDSRRAYNFVRPCNEWTGEALRTAGMRAGVWTPLAKRIMLRLEVAPAASATQASGSAQLARPAPSPTR